MKLFVSRDTEQISAFSVALGAHGISVLSESLITFQPVSFSIPDVAVDWIFFSSGRAVAFFAGKIDKDFFLDKKIACIGKGTEQVLLAHGLRAQFVGRNMDTQTTAQNFAKEIGQGKVLFPIGNQSLRTVQQVLPAGQVVDLICYETQAKTEIARRDADFLLFTSPSNVRAYFDVHDWQNHQTVLVLGRASASAAVVYGISKVIEIADFSDQAVLQAINPTS